MNFSIIFVIAIVAMIGMTVPSIFAQSGIDDILEKRVLPIKQKCTGSESKIYDTCDYKCGDSKINFTIRDDEGNFIKKGVFGNRLNVPLEDYPENSIITLSKDNFQDNELKLCKLNIAIHDDTSPKFESYNYEEIIPETKTNPKGTYTYAQIYATADQARYDCDNRYGGNQFAWNDCYNNVNTWESDQLDRTDYYGEPQREPQQLQTESSGVQMTGHYSESEKTSSNENLKSDNKGGGCLIATATYGSEMAPQVQQLRELRDNQLLQTASGTAFMGTFNDVYYSFSPIIADYERENPYFKEAVKLAITPMISSLSLMNNANSESEVLSIGISVIMLNIGMYLGIPAIVVVGIRKTVNS